MLMYAIQSAYSGAQFTNGFEQIAFTKGTMLMDLL